MTCTPEISRPLPSLAASSVAPPPNLFFPRPAQAVKAGWQMQGDEQNSLVRLPSPAFCRQSRRARRQQQQTSLDLALVFLVGPLRVPASLGREGEGSTLGTLCIP